MHAPRCLPRFVGVGLPQFVSAGETVEKTIQLRRWIEVCHNHYNRESTAGGGWGMIRPLAAGDSNAAVGDGLFHRTNNLYYRLLNCGFRLGVSGGSAIGVMPAATGHNRVYAGIEG